MSPTEFDPELEVPLRLTGGLIGESPAGAVELPKERAGNSPLRRFRGGPEETRQLSCVNAASIPKKPGLSSS